MKTTFKIGDKILFNDEFGKETPGEIYCVNPYECNSFETNKSYFGIVTESSYGLYVRDISEIKLQELQS